MNNCELHIDWAGEVCPDCELEVDEFGNTEDDFQYCCFPHCGCDGARLCMAPDGASDRALKGNVEGMWSGKTKEQLRARAELMLEANKKEKNDA